MKTLTIHEAVEITLSKLNKVSKLDEIKQYIVSNNLYDFGAKEENIKDVIRTQIERKCINLQHRQDSQKDQIFFKIAPKTYALKEWREFSEEKLLKLNNIYAGDDIREAFGCSLMGGISYGKKTNVLVLIRKHIDNLYEDRQEGDIIYYTGEGQVGNQDLVRGNKAINESNENNTNMVLFDVFSKGEYTYKGVVKLISQPMIEKQLDAEDNVRDVYVFPLKLVSSNLINSYNEVHTIQEKKAKKAKKLNEKKLKKLTIQSEQKKPGYSYTKTKTFQRSPYVIETVLRRANGICELCKEKAPFEKKDGTPYLEVHHIKQLAKGGSDTVNNAAALCPNCHRKMHSLSLEADIKILNNKALQ